MNSLKQILISVILISFPLSFTQAITPSPKIMAISHINLGEIQAGQVLEHALTVQNNGNADLVISSITSDCPCTTFQIPDKGGSYQQVDFTRNITIRPGESVELKLIFDSNMTKYRGAFKKLIVINSNDPDVLIKRVEMVGKLVP